MFRERERPVYLDVGVFSAMVALNGAFLFDRIVYLREVEMIKGIVYLVLVFATIFCPFQAYAGDALNPDWVPEIGKPEWMPDIEAGLTFETKYIWRGQLMVEDPVLQPEASLSKYGLTLSWWANFSTASDQNKWTEHDYTVDYTFNIGEARKFLNIDEGSIEFINPFGFSFGHIFYVFPEASGKNFHSEEFYLSSSYDCFFQPFVTWYVDYARGAGSYVEFGIAPSVDLENGISAGAGVTFGYNAGQWGYGYKFAPMLLSGEISIPILKYFTVTPNINYSVALDRTRKDGGLAYGSEFYGGVKVSVAY